MSKRPPLSPGEIEDVQHVFVRITGRYHIPWPDRDDLIQTAWVSFWARYNNPNKPTIACLTAYALLVAIHLCWHYQRGRDLGAIDFDRLEDGSAVDPATHAIREEDRKRLLRRLDMLPSRERECLVLRYFSGLSDPAISEKSGLPLGTVKDRIRRGIARLRDLWDGPPGIGRSA